MISLVIAIPFHPICWLLSHKILDKSTAVLKAQYWTSYLNSVLQLNCKIFHSLHIIH